MDGVIITSALTRTQHTWSHLIEMESVSRDGKVHSPYLRSLGENEQAKHRICIPKIIIGLLNSNPNACVDWRKETERSLSVRPSRKNEQLNPATYNCAT